MKNIVGLALVLAGTASFAFAGGVQAPEIDASAGVAAVTLLAGGILVLRSRRKT